MPQHTKYRLVLGEGIINPYSSLPERTLIPRYPLTELDCSPIHQTKNVFLCCLFPIIVFFSLFPFKI